MVLGDHGGFLEIYNSHVCPYNNNGFFITSVAINRINIVDSIRLLKKSYRLGLKERSLSIIYSNIEISSI